jgi:diguanylate cyclase (GGDEF)-like protein
VVPITPLTNVFRRRMPDSARLTTMATTKKRSPKPAPSKKGQVAERGAGAAPSANGARPSAGGGVSDVSPARRRGDSIGPLTKDAANQPRMPKKGGRLRNEIVIPLGIGALALSGSLGIVAAATMKIGAPTVVVCTIAAFILIGGLMAYVAWIIDGIASKPLARVRTALQEMEEGNYDARLVPDGAAELCDLAYGFNQMATIVGHQRERLKLMAATDSLTGLANHRHFHEQLRADLQTARDTGESLAVAAIDIDAFKKINDERGHARGDEALRLAAEALEKAVRGDDLVARLGGDDFILLLHGADSAYARDVTERARCAVIRALPDDIDMSASAGFVCFPDSCDEDSNLAELAAAALDVAKRNGGDQTRKYDREQVSAIPTVKQQRAEIDALLAQEEPITPVFQPLVDLGTGRTLGYEALSRFNSEINRSPDAWFNQAQQCGRGLQLEMEAIRAALAAPGRPPGSYLSLNFSPSAIASSKIMSVLPQDLSGVMIEITEHELAAEDGALEEGLERLRARGARIAVDDAGSGYAGLKQLMRVQPDVIKLDRALIEGIHNDGAKTALVEFFVMFARRVGAGICTEGIETVDELRTLINLGVNYGQGFLLGRPAEPWAQVSPEITRALATGALRTHMTRSGSVASVPSVTRSAAPAVAATAGPRRSVPEQQGASVRWRAPSPSSPRPPRPPSGPINRRLNRY